jgi:hypothetical protein
MVVWLNEYFGQVESDRNIFEAMVVYSRHRGKFAGGLKRAFNTQNCLVKQQLQPKLKAHREDDKDAKSIA